MYAMAILSAYHVNARLKPYHGLAPSSVMSRLVALDRLLQQVRSSMMATMAALEVMGLLGLMVSAGTHRTWTHVGVAYTYLQILRLMVHAKESRGLHREAWRQLYGRIAPLVRYVPVVEAVVGRLQTWFTGGR